MEQENYDDWVEIGQLDISELTPEQLVEHNNLDNKEQTLYNL